MKSKKKKEPDHEWLGTILIGTVEVRVRAFSAFGRATPPTIYQVHRHLCESSSENSEESEGASRPSSSGSKSLSRVGPKGIVCKRCGKDMAPDDIGWEVTLKNNVKVQLELQYFKAPEFPKSEDVEGRLIHEDDPIVMTIGFERAFYIFPEPDFLEEYWALFEKLQTTKGAVFLPQIVFDRPYVGVLKPMVIPPEVFGEDSMQKPRKVLVLLALNDTDKLKDPWTFSRCPKESVASPGEYSDTRLPPFSTVKPRECVNPRTAPIFEAVRNARKRAEENRAS